MEILSKFSKRLKELMDEAEIKSPALGANIGLEPSAITKFLRAERLPSAATLVKLADYFNCTTDYLLGLSDVLDDRKFKQRPPFCKQIDVLIAFSHKTQYRFGIEAELSDETFRRWRKGKNEASVETLVKIAKYLKCSVDFVLGRES